VTNGPSIASVACDLHTDAIDELAARWGDVPLNRTGTGLPRAEVEAAIRGRRGLLVGARTVVDGPLLELAGDRLAVVSTNSVGFDHLLPGVEYAAAHGIALTHTPKVLSPAVAEQAITFMAWFLRRPLAGHRAVVEGRFATARSGLLHGLGFEGTVLGIVGLGSTGCATARRAAALGMPLLGCDIDDDRPAEEIPRIERVDLPELLARADVVSLHVDLNPTSRHLIDADALARMKVGAGLVNTSRGPVVDEGALVAAMAAGRPGWVALDVFEHEPDLHPGLLALATTAPERVLFAPHTASGTRRARRAMADCSTSNLHRAIEGDWAGLDLIPPLRISPGWHRAFTDRVRRGNS
jgi:glyoxylate reductase